MDISELTGRGNGNDSDGSAIISGELRISDDDDDDDDDDEDDDEEGENGSGSAGPLPQWLRKMIQDKARLCSIDSGDGGRGIKWKSYIRQWFHRIS